MVQEALKPTVIPVSGKLITSKDPLTLGQGDFQELTNMRYKRKNPISVMGMTKLNVSTVVDGTTFPGAYMKTRQGFHFKKDTPTDMGANPGGNGEPEPFDPPGNEYLIGWYKFDDGAGATVNNYADDGSSGGGLLPDLDVVDIAGDFWTAKTGFGSTATLQPASTDFAWVDLGSTRTYGGSAGGYACYGIFYSRFSTTTGGCACSLFNDNVGTVSTGTEFDVGTNVGGLYRSEAGWRSNTAVSTYVFANTTWSFLFIDSTGYFYVVQPNGTLVSVGSINVAMATAVTLRYLHAGVRYDIAAPDYGRSGCNGSYGDWIIYNYTRLTLAEWAEWYDELRTRYGMSARSGW